MATGPHLFFEMSYLADIKAGRRPVYLADAALALRYAGTDSVEKGLLELQHYAPLDVQDFKNFCASHNEFLLYSSNFPFEWVTEELLQQQRKLTVEAQKDGATLFLVTSEKP